MSKGKTRDHSVWKFTRRLRDIRCQIQITRMAPTFLAHSVSVYRQGLKASEY